MGKMEENNNYLTNEKKVAETKLADLQVSMKVIKSKYEDENNALKKSVAIIQGEKDEVEARLEAARSENEVMVCAEKLEKIEEDNVRLMTEKKIFESKIVDLHSSLDKLSSTCKDENEALQTTITALQGERDNLQVRCSAAMSLNEVTVCENKSLEEKIKEIEEDTNALMNEKKISETKISGLQVSMEEVKSKYDEIYKNFNRMSSENQVLNDIIAAEHVKNDELRQNEQERKKEIELFCSERESQRVHLESMSARSMALEEQIEGIKARQEDERSIRDEECEKAVVLQGAKDELEARCIAAMSEND